MTDQPYTPGKRSSISGTWYSSYQKEVVGQPKTVWSPEDRMSNGYTNSVDILGPDGGVSTGTLIDFDEPSSSTVIETRVTNLNETGKTKATDGVFKGDPFSTHMETQRPQLIATTSFDTGWNGRDDEYEDAFQPYPASRSMSMVTWNDTYEEFKLPRRYQKPNTKINPRLGRTYVMGAGNEKCKQCGQRLYEMEKVIANHFSYHRSCFRCIRCQRLLSLGNFTSLDGNLFCKLHSRTSLSEMPTTNGLEENSQNKSEAETLNTAVLPKVTLASISDMKTRFEVASSDQLDPERKPSYQEPLKTQKSQDWSSAKSTKENVETRAKGVEKKTEPDKNLTPQTSEITVTLTNSTFIHIPETYSTIKPSPGANAIVEDPAEVIPIADAFAKFRGMENKQTEYGERKPVRKITPPIEEQRYFIEAVQQGSPDKKPTEGTAGGKPSSSVARDQSGKSQQTFTVIKVNSSEIPNKSDANSAARSEIKSEKVPRLEMDTFENPFTGITKRLLTQFETLESQGETKIPNQKSPPTPATPVPSEQTRGQLPKVQNQYINGYHSPNISHNSPPSQKENESGRNNMVPEKTSAGSLDFTRSQLALFKQREQMAQLNASQIQPKKTFQWGVKEVNPLHRPCSTIPQELCSIEEEGTEGEPKPVSPQLTNGTTSNHDLEQPSPASADRHLEQPSLASTDRPDGAVEETPACMKEALAQFKSMEDLTRPPPNPVVALNQQKVAFSTAPKPYHDVIYISYYPNAQKA